MEGETVAAEFYRANPYPLAPKFEPDSHGLTYLPDEEFNDGVRAECVR